MESNTVTEKKELKSERVQEPAAAAAGVKEAGWVELAVNPYQRVTIDLPVLQVNITLEQPVAGADWNAGLEPAE